MTSDLVFSFVRQLLTFGGAYAVSKGLVDGGTAETAIGALATLLSVGWSVVTHKAPAKV
jgi:hypothetical protein